MSLTKRAFVLCASLALVSLAVAAGGANAAPPLAGSGTFTYQCWYRNADPTYCTPSTFNLTNALYAIWAP